MNTLGSTPEEGISVIQQLGMDIRRVVESARVTISKIMEKQTPPHEIAKYIENAYPGLFEKTTLSGGSSCNGLSDNTGKQLVRATFIERTGDLILTHDDHKTKNNRDIILQEVIFIIKLLTDGYQGYTPEKLTMKDHLTTHHVRMLQKAGIKMEIGIEDNERSVVLTKQ